jgi:hypothetical protein
MSKVKKVMSTNLPRVKSSATILEANVMNDVRGGFGSILSISRRLAR